MKPLFAIILCLAIVQSCKKNTKEPKKDEPFVDVEMNKISAKPWLIYRVDLNGLNVWNAGLIEKCQKDDTYRFYKDSVLMVYDNVDKCSGGTDSTDSYWQFYKGRKRLIGTILGTTDTADILVLDPSSMILGIDLDGSPLKVYSKND